MKEITDQDRTTRDHMTQIDPRHTVEMGEAETAALREWLKRREEEKKDTGQHSAWRRRREVGETKGLGGAGAWGSAPFRLDEDVVERLGGKERARDYVRWAIVEGLDKSPLAPPEE